ncbi:MAG: copper-binding protein [Acidobacteria bacterium]|nr:copper-binding protein [Acidobacteriota bacterium]
MTIKLILTTVAITILTACGNTDASKPPTAPAPNAASPAAAKPADSPMPTMQSTPKNGEYPGKGKVTKINNELGSVEMNHEEIVGVMPPMLMEFYVTDKAMLKGLAVGDAVEFMLRYKDGQETISKIEKTK